MAVDLQTIKEQISYIIAEHKTCGGHCHHYDEPNDSVWIIKENEHLAGLISYYVKGICDGI